MLFGQHTGRDGTLIITEGELDCMSIYECLSTSELRKTVVCSLNSGAGSVKKQIENNLRFILGFERVILFFDQDEAGEKILPQAAEIIGPKTDGHRLRTPVRRGWQVMRKRSSWPSRATFRPDESSERQPD